MTDIDSIRAKYIVDIADAKDEATLEEVRLAALGKKGEISLIMRALGAMDPQERQTEAGVRRARVPAAGPDLRRGRARQAADDHL